MTNKTARAELGALAKENIFSSLDSDSENTTSTQTNKYVDIKIDCKCFAQLQLFVIFYFNSQ